MERAWCPTAIIGAVDFPGWLKRGLEARATGLKVQVVARWLPADPAGRATPSRASWRRVARASDVDSNRVLTAAGHRPVEPGEDRPASPFEAEIRYRVRCYERLLRSIPERHRGIIVPLLDDAEQAAERLLDHESHGDAKPPAIQAGASVVTDL